MTSEVIEGHIWLEFIWHIRFEPIFIKIFMNAYIMKMQFFIKWSMASEIIKGKKKVNFSFRIFFYLIKTKYESLYYEMQCFIKWSMTSKAFLCFGEVLYFFTFSPSDLNTTLTYVLMDNFHPCFLHILTI